MPGRRRLPRNVAAASTTSFLMDVSTEMVVHVLPLYLAHGLGARTAVIGLIEGLAGAMASLLRAGSGWLSDRLGRRKPLAVAGYAISALTRPGLALASTWSGVGVARVVDRIGKGLRTAPRDALVADSLGAAVRGEGFGFHRAADTAGAVVGIGIALAVVGGSAGGTRGWPELFRTLAWLSLVPAALAVLALQVGAREPPRRREPADAGAPGRPKVPRAGRLPRAFFGFLGVVALFDLGDFPDAFRILRADERGLGLVGILWVLLAHNLVYAAVALPAGRLSDRVGRARVLAAAFGLHGAVQLAFAAGPPGALVALPFLVQGVQKGLLAGALRAAVADLVPSESRGTAYGILHAVLGLLDLPAALLAGLLWQGAGDFAGFGPRAPFLFATATSLLAALLVAAVADGGPGADPPPRAR